MKVAARAVALGLTATFAAGMGNDSWAQEMSPQTAQAARTIPFDIPAQPLGSALTAFGRQSGLQIVVDPAAVAGRTSEPLTGAMTVEQALQHLLGGIGIPFRFTSATSVSVGVGAGASSGAMQLDPVRVEAEGGAQSAFRSPRGYVATQSATGTKTDTPIVETPQSISVVTKKQIADQGAQSVNQALAYTAGVQTAPYGYDARYDQFIIRGFAANQFGNYRDGLRQGSGSFAYFRNDPYDLERIDILRGPTSVLFGANEAGGLINLVSKMPTATPSHEVAVDIGTYDRYQVRVDLGGPIDQGGRLLYRITGLFRDSSTQVPQTPDDRINVSPALTARISDDTTITFLGNYAHNRNSMWPYYLRTAALSFTGIRVGDPSFDGLEQNQWSIGYRLEHRFSDALIVRQNLRYSQVDFTGSFVDADSVVGSTLNRYSGQWIEHLKTFNIDNQVQVRFATGPLGHTLLAGVDYFNQAFSQQQRLGTAPALNLANPVYSFGAVNLTTLVGDNFQKLDQVGLYAQDQLAFGGLRLTLGGRVDMVNLSTYNNLTNRMTGQSPSAFTGRAGLLYLFENGIAPYVSYATSFLPVNGTTSPARGSTPFMPTTGELFEGGIKYQPVGINALVTASVFQITKNNVSTTDPNNTLFSVQTGQVRSRGFEIEGQLSLANGLNALGSFSYTDVLVTQSNGIDLGKVPVGVPAYQAAAFLDYTQQRGRLAGLGGGAGIRYIGETWADTGNTFKNSGTTAVDLTLHYDFEKFGLAVVARNVFDQEVPICNSGNCTLSQGRTLLGTLTARW